MLDKLKAFVILKQLKATSTRVFFSENSPPIHLLRRAASSVGANIAEGCGRFHYKDKNKFYYNARGSAYEVQNFLFLSQDLEYVEKEKAREIFLQYEDLIRLINGTINSINKRITDNK